jgi:putative ABC transport system permease protein
MRADADALYDGTNLWDVRLISTLGFSDDDVARVRDVDGVRAAMPSLTCDAMARLGTEQVAVRISSLDVGRAAASVPEGAYVITSPDEAYLNRPRLVDGRWPEACGECVVSADVPREDYGIGDTVELLYGTSDLDDLLATTTLTIVGTASSSMYPYTGSFGSTTLGSGMIDQYLFVAPASLAEEAPYTVEYYLDK